MAEQVTVIPKGYEVQCDAWHLALGVIGPTEPARKPR
jgi:hypothetical protein